jgi:NAD(P)H-nitrite reductase large subunit
MKDRIVCECLKVTEGKICSVIRQGKACTVRQVTACTGAGDGCMACHPALEQLIDREAPRSYLASSPSFSVR